MINLKTHYSILQAFSKPEDLVTKGKKLGLSVLGIADYNLSGCVKFYKACKEADIKPLLGLTIERGILIAKNKNGWKNLLDLSSGGKVTSTEDLIFVFGEFKFLLEQIYDDPQSYYENKQCRVDCLEQLGGYVEHCQSIYPSVYIGLPPVKYEADNRIRELLVDLAREYRLPIVPTCETYYVEPEQADLHRIQLCAQLKTSMRGIKDKFAERPDIQRFFEREDYCVNADGVFQDELMVLANQCEDPDILQRQQMPHFANDDGLTENEYFKELCRKGWRSRLNLSREEREVYKHRILHEFTIIEDMNLEGYFLIMQDITNWIREQGWLMGVARGSAGGSLVSYLLGITDLNPIPYDLLFERFLNPARKDAMADIDIDVPREHRNTIIDYVRDKYGRDSVAQIITFGEMNGRLALREVLHRKNACTPEEINLISKSLPDKAKFEAQMKADGESSLIMWALKRKADDLKDYCRLEDNELVGDYAEYFKTAVQLEGTIKSTGKHASAVVVYDGKIRDVCPLTEDKNSDEKKTQFSMDDAEDVGLLKLDILGVATLDKLMRVNVFLKKRYKEHND
jgi:DNA polymerase III subunit alpha